MLLGPCLRLTERAAGRQRMGREGGWMERERKRGREEGREPVSAEGAGLILVEQHNQLPLWRETLQQ